MSVFRSWNIDLVAFLLFDRSSCRVRHALVSPSGVVQDAARNMDHVNGHQFITSIAMMAHPEVTDVTAELRATAKHPSDWQSAFDRRSARFVRRGTGDFYEWGTGILPIPLGGAGGNRTPVPQPVDELATTIPGIASDAETPTGRLRARGPSRIVFPTSQQSFPLAMVFPIVIPHFCCQAVVEWPRATFLLTMTLHSSDRNQAARANRSLAILFFPRLTSLRNSGCKLEQRY